MVTTKSQCPEVNMASLATVQMRNQFFLSHCECFALLTLEGMIQDTNQAMDDFLGIPTRSRGGIAFDEAFAAFGFAPWADLEPKLKNAGECQFKDWFRLAADGSVKLLRFHIHRMRDEDGLPIGYAMTGLDLSAEASQQDKLERLASQDTLTGLYNRRYIEEKASELIARPMIEGACFAVMLLDLDSFKSVNDTLGHGVGDQMLRHVAEAMNDVVPLGETVGRLGGDEFVVIIEDYQGRKQTHSLAEEIGQAIARPALAGPHRVKVSTSIGISVFPEDGKDLASLLAHADREMFRSKNKARIVAAPPEKEGWRASQSVLVAELNAALEGEQFIPHFQPIVDLKTGSLSSLEALCRWQHPVRGILAPSHFISIAEHYDLIAEIDMLMLRHVCRFIKKHQAGPLGHLRVFANVSAATVGKPDFAAFVEQTLAETGAPAGALGLELTESMALLETEHGHDSMTRLAKAGVALALDDFGTGFSSVSLLKDLPVSHLKLDRSFVHNVAHQPRDLSLVAAIATLGSALGALVVAEGIETEQQRDALRAIPGLMGQGYLFGYPMRDDLLIASLAD